MHTLSGKAVGAVVAGVGAALGALSGLEQVAQQATPAAASSGVLLPILTVIANALITLFLVGWRAGDMSRRLSVVEQNVAARVSSDVMTETVRSIDVRFDALRQQYDTLLADLQYIRRRLDDRIDSNHRVP